MKIIFILFSCVLGLGLLGGCTSKPPSCEDPATLKLAESILRENTQGLTPEYKVEAGFITSDGYEEAANRWKCHADFKIIPPAYQSYTEALRAWAKAKLAQDPEFLPLYKSGEEGIAGYETELANPKLVVKTDYISQIDLNTKRHLLTLTSRLDPGVRAYIHKFEQLKKYAASIPALAAETKKTSPVAEEGPTHKFVDISVQLTKYEMCGEEAVCATFLQDGKPITLRANAFALNQESKDALTNSITRRKEVCLNSVDDKFTEFESATAKCL